MTVCSDIDLHHIEFYQDVIDGLSKSQKTLPCKYFYDERGSLLFEQICSLDEYYVTRTELGLLASIHQELARIIGPDARVIEPGSGAGEKIKLLLGSLESPASYTPIEISQEILVRSTKEIAQHFPDLNIHPIVGDFNSAFSDKALFNRGNTGKNIVFFPGSTIGNFSPAEALDFLSSIADAIGTQGAMIIGVDLIKETTVLEAAYNDAKGITAAFNLNILQRINNELDGSFDLDTFQHHALFNTDKNRIEMHLISQQDQYITINDESFFFAKDESIHTENSHKYSAESFKNLAQQAGFNPIKIWQDPDSYFSIHYLEAA